MKKIYYLIAALLLVSSTLYSQFNPVYNWMQIPSGTVSNLNYSNATYICGNNGVMLKTTSSGITWQPVTTGSSGSLKSVQFYISTVIAIGEAGLILKSTNEGLSWNSIPGGTPNNLNSLLRIGSAQYIVAGDGGTILRTTNSGDNWSVVASGTSVNLKSIAGATNIIAVGNNGIILKSAYPGTSWNQVPSGTTQNINSVDVFSSTAIVVGAGGLILRSTDNGGTWQQMVSGTTAELNSVDVFSSTEIFAAGNNIVVKSTDNGSTWSVISDSRLPSLNWSSIYAFNKDEVYVTGPSGNIYRKTYDSLYAFAFTINANNMRAFIWNSGVFNQNRFLNNTPGCEWLSGTGKYAIFTTGLTTAAYVNGSLRMAAVSYNGELLPGYCVNGNYMYDSRFKLYKVEVDRPNDSDWINWGRMVPFGAPFNDVNSNGTYEPTIDIPGMKGAKQTIFLCMTDANPLSHTMNEGFGGGTNPLGAEYHLTAWAYDVQPYKDIVFFKWVVINKSVNAWDSTVFSIVADPDIGLADDDYIGCDTTRNLMYAYNADNEDGDGGGRTYGINPPASGFSYLNCSGGNSFISSMTFYTNFSTPGALCERDPENPALAYNIMKGLKKDGTPFVIPNTNPPRTTKFVYSGDPETNSGWTEYGGKIDNCGGILTGNLTIPAPPGDRRNLMSYKPLNQKVNPNDTQVVILAQMVARGNNNKNSVTLLKQLSDIAKNLCENNFIIGISPISNEIPVKYNLYQNYPNPFNPFTKIRFALPLQNDVTIIIYDAIGREITTLVNEKLNPGVYSIDWDGSAYPSGVYFYMLKSGSFTETKKMVLVK